MSLFKTSAHVSQKYLALATFASMAMSGSENWFSGDARKSLMEEGYTAQQAEMVCKLTFNAKLADWSNMSMFDKKENQILGLVHHLVWYSVAKALDGNTERAERARNRVREVTEREEMQIE